MQYTSVVPTTMSSNVLQDTVAEINKSKLHQQQRQRVEKEDDDYEEERSSDDNDDTDDDNPFDALGEALYTSSGRSLADVIDYHMNKQTKILLQISKNLRG